MAFAATRPRARAAAIGAVIVALSALLVAPVPTYDSWSWLLWGREVASLSLSTAEGPAFKPLPVGVCALLSVLGPTLAPIAWVLVARAGAVVAVWAAYRAAGALAAAAVALTGAFIGYAATGVETGWTVAFALLALAAWRDGRLRAALLWIAACALLRVEAWPFLALAGVAAWRRDRALLPLLVTCAVAVPALWFVPEWLGSGDPLRSGARARVPNPGQPATEAIPALAALREAALLPLVPLWLGALFAPKRLRLTLYDGLAWIALVAVMAQAGFSGEPRYSLPGAACVAVAGAAGLVELARRRAAYAALIALALALAAAPTLADLPGLRRDQAYQRRLATDLRTAIDAAGGRARLLACGRPYVGHLRGPLLAYHLRVEKRLVAFDPRPPGVVFVSRLRPKAPLEPSAHGFAPDARAGLWQIRVRCS
jgi:MFS family permease